MPDHPTEQPTTPASPPMPPTSVGMPVGPSDPWPHTGPTELAAGLPASAPAGGWRQRFWLPVLAGTAVLAVTAFLVVFLWPGGSSGPLEFHAFEPMRTIEVGDEETDPGIVWLDGDRVFLAATGAEGAVVFGTQVSGDGDRWERAIPEQSEVNWMAAYDETLAVSGEHSDGEYDHHLLTMLDAGSGEPLWQREYSGSRHWLFAGGWITQVDSIDGVLRGLDLRTGAEQWALRYPEGGATIRPVITEEDLAERSRPGQEYEIPRHGDRLVMVGSDGYTQVFDVENGQPVGDRAANVAGPDDVTYAYEDGFFVASESDGRLYRFNLADLSAQPELLYRPSDPDARIMDLVPCGDGRICLQEEGGAEAYQVVFVDMDGDAPRSQTVDAEPQLLLPVGNQLVVATDAGTAIVFDQAGNPVETLPGVPVRINDANILLASPDNPYGYGTMSVTGLPIGSQRTELGQVSDVASDGCAFDDELLICPTSTGAGIWRFAAG